MKNTIKVRQTHKDRLFCNLFSKKENALSLYNALNGTDYKNENELEIVTLEDAKNFHIRQKAPKTFANNNNQSNMHNFTQRDYDFDALEQQLLQKQFADELMEN